VEAEVYGDYAVHLILYGSPTDYDVFSVTHIASGLMVAFTEVLDDARGFAQDMNGKNVADQLKAIRRGEAGGLLQRPSIVKLLTKYKMGVYITRGKDAETQGRPTVYYGR
jgi:hypothetical protein